MLYDEFWLKVYEIFDLDSLFSDAMEVDSNSETTYCSEAEIKISQERARIDKIYLWKSYEDFENESCSDNSSSQISQNKALGDIQDEANCFGELMEALDGKPKPTIDGFVSCLKKFNRSTLVQLHTQLSEYLREDEKDSKNRQEEEGWYKNFKLTNKERKDSLQYLRKLAKNNNK